MDPQQQSREQSAERLVAWSVVCLALFSIAVYIGYRYDTTLWDWLKLLVVPAVIAGGGIWFNRQQRERELEIARQQREQDQDIAREQRKQDLRIAERRTRDETLQAYLDQMSDMLIPGEGQPSLYKARPGDRLSFVARARTLTVLPRLDGERKARVVQFLFESDLIAKGHPVLDLRGVDLRGADLNGADLSGAILREADLMGANLSDANLSGMHLREACLREADLRRAYVLDANLMEADLSGANLRKADLNGADLSVVNLREADLNGARLIGVDLTGADLSGAILSGAILSSAILSDANLTQADLREAISWTEEQLSEARSLEDATMPNGQKYEDWLKSKDREKEGENE